MEHAIVLSARCQLDLNDFSLKKEDGSYFYPTIFLGKNHSKVVGRWQLKNLKLKRYGYVLIVSVVCSSTLAKTVFAVAW